MTVTEFIKRCLEQNNKSLMEAVEGLSLHELSWRPEPHCNSIGLLTWHCGRVIDRWIHSRIRGVPQLWEEGWAEKFNRSSDPNDTGFGFTADQLEAFQVPSEAVLVGYVEATWGKFMEYIQGLEDDALESVMVPTPYGGEITLSTAFLQLIWELNQHSGQVAYLRGMQRGIENGSYTRGVFSRRDDDAG